MRERARAGDEVVVAAPSVVRGYRVTVTWKPLTPKESAEKRSAVARVLARNLPK